MENGFSVLMLIFGAALLLYAAVLSGGNHKLLPARVTPTLQRKDKKGQTKRIAAITAVVALSPVIGGLLGLWKGNTLCLIGMGATAAISIALAVIKKRSHRDE
jgi:cyanate permease